MGDNLESTRITISIEIALQHTEILESKNLRSGSTEPPLTDNTPPLAAIIDESDASNGLSVGDICLVVWATIIIVPLFLLYAFAAYLICNKYIIEDTDVVPQVEKKRIYQMAEDF